MGFYGESYQYKLKGSPFGRFSGPEVVGGIRLVRDLIIFLGKNSWELVTPLLCSAHVGAKDSLFFRKVDNTRPSPSPKIDLEWLVLGMTGNDRLRVIYDDVAGVGDATDVKPGLSGLGTYQYATTTTTITQRHQAHMEELIAAFKKVLEGMDLFQKGEWSHDCYEFKMKGMPWWAHRVKTVRARVLMLKVLEVLDGLGWRSRVAIGQRTGTDDVRQPDTWYFVREKGGRKTSGAGAGTG